MLKDMTPTAIGSCFRWKAICTDAVRAQHFLTCFCLEAREAYTHGTALGNIRRSSWWRECSIWLYCGKPDSTTLPALWAITRMRCSSASCVLITNAGLARCTLPSMPMPTAVVSWRHNDGRSVCGPQESLALRVELLLRHTGMRIGECVNLPFDCLRTLGPGQWAIHVPIGKLKTERWVPVDSTVCQIIDRLRSLRPPDTPITNRFLLVRPRSRYSMTRMLRTALRQTVRAVGITTRLVPHQFRHSYSAGCAGWRQLRCSHEIAGPQEPAHDHGVCRNHPTGSPARVSSHARSCTYMLLASEGYADHSTASMASSVPGRRRYVLEMLRRALPNGASRNRLGHFSNRLAKILAKAYANSTCLKIGGDWPVKSRYRKVAASRWIVGHSEKPSVYHPVGKFLTTVRCVCEVPE